MGRRKGTSDSLWRELADRTDAGRETVRWQFKAPSLDSLRAMFRQGDAERQRWERAHPGGADAMLLVAYFQSRGMVRVVCNALGC